MKSFKIIDFWVSVTLIICYTIIYFSEQNKALIISESLIQGYLVIGSWQVISMIIHVVNKKEQAFSLARKAYTWVTITCLLTMPMGFFMFAILLYTAPFMAIIYTSICGIEVFSKLKAPIPFKLKTTIIKIISISICMIITTCTLSQFSKLIQHLLSIKYNWMFESAMIIGMLLFQLLFIFRAYKRIIIDYFSKMLFVSLIGSMLLWPLLFINNYFKLSDAINIVYFFSVISIMFFIHKRFVTKLKLPFYLSYTYILYRFIILLFIL